MKNLLQRLKVQCKASLARILRFAQNDKGVGCHSEELLAATKNLLQRLKTLRKAIVILRSRSRRRRIFCYD